MVVVVCCVDDANDWKNIGAAIRPPGVRFCEGSSFGVLVLASGVLGVDIGVEDDDAAIGTPLCAASARRIRSSSSWNHFWRTHFAYLSIDDL